MRSCVPLAESRRCMCAAENRWVAHSVIDTQLLAAPGSILDRKTCPLTFPKPPQTIGGQRHDRDGCAV